MPCEDPSLLKIVLFLSTMVNVVRIFVPILLIILISMDIGKHLFVEEQEFPKIKKKVLNKFIAAVIVFFVPPIVGGVMSFLSSSAPEFLACFANATPEKIKYFEEQERINGPGDGGTTPVVETTVELTVGTWNIGRGNKVSGVTASKLAKEIKDNNIDIIGIQEARSNGETLIASITQILGMPNYYYTSVPAGNAIIYEELFKSKGNQKLVSCGEERALQKTEIELEGKLVSFYNVHISYQQECRSKQIRDVYSKIKDDSNPIILVGDFNVGRSCDTITDNLGSDFDLVAYDTESSGIKCTDSIIISENSGISLKSKKTVDTKGSLSDHNFVIATFEIE